MESPFSNYHLSGITNSVAEISDCPHSGILAYWILVYVNGLQGGPKILILSSRSVARSGAAERIYSRASQKEAQSSTGSDSKPLDVRRW